MRGLASSLLVLVAACGRENFDDAGDGSGSAVMTGDFDGDTIDNTVDNCPQAYNPIQQDGEGDGVGDACDPHPTTAGDRLLALALFDGGFGDFVPDTIANWSLAAYPGFVTTTAGADATLARLSVTTTVSTPTLQASFVVRDYASFTYDEVRLQLAGTNNFKCTARGVTSRIDEIYTYVNEASANNRGLTPVNAGALTTMSATWENEILTCTVGTANLPASYVGTALGTAVKGTIEIEGFQASLGYAALYGVL